MQLCVLKQPEPECTNVEKQTINLKTSTGKQTNINLHATTFKEHKPVLINVDIKAHHCEQIKI